MLAVCSPAPPQPFAADFATATSDLWHFRLGHPSHAKLSLLNKIVSDLAINKPHGCDICHLAKQKSLSFPSSTHVSNAIFDLIHCDLWGSLFYSYY